MVPQVSRRLTEAYVWTTLAVLGLVESRPARRERGDVPGWVLITVMTAGLVVAIWIVAQKQLTEIFTNAVNSVSGK